MLFLLPTPLLATPMYILRFGPMACETLGGVPLTGETERLEKELEGCSVGMLGRGDMRRLILLKEVETMDGEHLKDMPAMMEPCAPGKPVCHSTYNFYKIYMADQPKVGLPQLYLIPRS